MSEVKIAIIPAAGLGTRLRPLSQFVPKEMFPVANVPLIHLSIAECARAGIGEIIIILRKDKDLIRQYTEWLRQQAAFSALQFHYIYQEVPTGSGDALLLAESLVDGQPFAVLLPDNIFLPQTDPLPLQQLLTVFRHRPFCLHAMEEMKSPEEILPYGNIRGKLLAEEESCLRVERVLEKPRLDEIRSPYATVGRYILLPEMFAYLRQVQQELTDSEHHAPIAFNRYAQENVFLAMRLTGIRRYDTGNPEGYLRALAAYAEANRNRNC